MNDEATPQGLGSTEQLGQATDRAAFDRWLRDNGHCEDQLDDMLMPLQRSLNNLMWSAWQGAVAAERERWKRIAAAAQAVTEKAEDIGDFLVSSHLMSALALALDDRPNAELSGPQRPARKDEDAQE